MGLNIHTSPWGFFYSNSQFYTTVLKSIKNKHPPPWRTAVSRCRRTQRRLQTNCCGPRRLVAVHGG
jgi:hypothetical protein